MTPGDTAQANRKRAGEDAGAPRIGQTDRKQAGKDSDVLVPP